MRKTKVGVVQATPALFDKPKTIDIVCHWIERAAKEGCELLLWENSVDLSTDDLKKIQSTIKANGLKVALGVTERHKSLMCSLVYFNNDGTIIGVHRKIKPTGLERFIWAESDGSTLQTFSTDLGVIGGLICWENYMPLAPTADARPSWQATMQHITLEGRCYL